MTEVARSPRQRLDDALAHLPTAEGGSAIPLATAGSPPAIVLLSTGDVHVDGDVVRVAVYAGSSAVSRLGGAFSLLVSADEEALRVEVVDAEARQQGQLAVLQGVLRDIRPTAEPPWSLEMRFRATSDVGVSEHVEYWQAVRAWLASGARGHPPEPPGSVNLG